MYVYSQVPIIEVLTTNADSAPNPNGSETHHDTDEVLPIVKKFLDKIKTEIENGRVTSEEYKSEQVQCILNATSSLQAFVNSKIPSETNSPLTDRIDEYCSGTSFWCIWTLTTGIAMGAGVIVYIAMSDKASFKDYVGWGTFNESLGYSEEEWNLRIVFVGAVMGLVFGFLVSFILSTLIRPVR